MNSVAASCSEREKSTASADAKTASSSTTASTKVHAFRNIAQLSSGSNESRTGVHACGSSNFESNTYGKASGSARSTVVRGMMTRIGRSPMVVVVVTTADSIARLRSKRSECDDTGERVEARAEMI